MDDYGYESMLMDTDVCWWMMDMGYGTIMGIFDEGCLSFSLWEPHNETNFQYGGQHLEAVDIYSESHGPMDWLPRFWMVWSVVKHGKTNKCIFQTMLLDPFTGVPAVS